MVGSEVELFHAVGVLLPAASVSLKLAVSPSLCVVLLDSQGVLLVLERVRRLKLFEDLTLGALPDPLSRSVAADRPHRELLSLLVAEGQFGVFHGLVEPVVELAAQVQRVLERAVRKEREVFLEGYEDLIIERHEPDVVPVGLVEVGRGLCDEGGSVGKVVVRVLPHFLVVDDVSSLLGAATSKEDEVEC